MKSVFTPIISGINNVAPYAGAWIEINQPAIEVVTFIVAPYAGAWIEMYFTPSPPRILSVAPYAGAWIEICAS